ncbi:MAG TPA: hypothetical protein VHW02_03890 [Rhizomicrobium sp.]|jgi:hypothetical protein|nr:hypothetical protein [Rhizomicrobium sp.]
MVSRVWGFCVTVLAVSWLGVAAAGERPTDIKGVSTGHDFWASMAFAVGPSTFDGRTRVYAVGSIDTGTADNFKRFLQFNAIGPGSVIVFHSPGGIVDEGLALGEIIRQKSFETAVGQRNYAPPTGPLGGFTDDPGVCASACSFAFLGGVARTVAAGSLYGVHDAYVEQPEAGEDLLDLGQRIAGKIAEYMHTMGADPRLLTVLTHYNSNKGEMFIMPADMMAKLRVTTQSSTTWSLRDTTWGFGLEGRNTALSDLPGNSERIVFTCAIKPRGVVVGGFYLPEAIASDSGHAKRMPPAQFVSAVKGYSLVAMASGGAKPLAAQIATYQIAPADVIRPARVQQTHYVMAFVRLPPAAANALRTASLLSFKFNEAQGAGGVTVDFASGRNQAMQFFANCR